METHRVLLERKIIIRLEEGSMTLSHVKPSSTNEQLLNTARAVARLCAPVTTEIILQEKNVIRMGAAPDSEL